MLLEGAKYNTYPLDRHIFTNQIIGRGLSGSAKPRIFYGTIWLVKPIRYKAILKILLRQFMCVRACVL